MLMPLLRRAAHLGFLSALLLPALLVPARLSAQPAQAPAGPTQAAPTITTSDGVPLHVQVSGQGLPCVFVHGGPGAGSYGFEALGGRALEKHLRLIYLDQRGSGRSGSAAGNDYSLDRQVQDLEEVRRQLGLERWVVMAHSFGGTIATAYAAKYPERVQALILVNAILNLPASMEATTAHGYALLPAAGRPPLDPAAPLPQRWAMVMGMLGQQKLMNKLMYATDTAAARASQVVRSQPRRNQDFAAAVFQRPEYLQDFTVASAQLKMPVLVLSGQEDFVTGPGHYKSFRFPNQQVALLPGKHYPFQENAREFQQAVAGFLRKLPRKA